MPIDPNLTLYTLEEILSQSGVLGDNVTRDISAQDMRDTIWSIYNIIGTAGGTGGTGGGGSASWGYITGTLSDQTDLQAALDSKLEEVNWGDIGGILSDQTDLQTVLDSKLDYIPSLQQSFDSNNGATLSYNDLLNPNEYFEVINTRTSIENTFSNKDGYIIISSSNSDILLFNENSITSLKNGLLGTVSTIYYDLGSQMLSSNPEYGDMYYGFGESDYDGTSADFSTLVGMSKVPKKYVDEQILESMQDLQSVLNNGSSASISDYLEIKTDNTYSGYENILRSELSSGSSTINLFGSIDESQTIFTDGDFFTGYRSDIDINNKRSVIETYIDKNTFETSATVETNVQLDNTSKINLISKKVSSGGYTQSSIDISVDETENYLLLSNRNMNGDILSFRLEDIITIDDDISSKGMVYGDDYSAAGELDDNWIPSWSSVKDYTDNAISASVSIYYGGTGISLLGYTFSTDASLVEITNTVGTYTPGTSVQETLESIYNLAASSATPNLQSVMDEGSVATVATSVSLGYASGGITSSLSLDDIYAIVNYNDTSTMIASSGGVGLNYVIGTSSLNFTLTNTSFMFNDQINNKGIVYSSDYSAVGELDDRWIPDYGSVKSYTDNAISTSESFYIAGDGLTMSEFVSQNATFSILIDPVSQGLLEVSENGLKLNQVETSMVYIDETPISGSYSVISASVSARLDIWGATTTPPLEIGDVVVFTELYDIITTVTYSESWIRSTTASSDNTDFVKLNRPDPTDAYIKSLFSGTQGVSYDNNGVFSLDPNVAGDHLTFDNGVLNVDTTLNKQTLQDVILEDGTVSGITSSVDIIYNQGNEYNRLLLSNNEFILNNYNTSSGTNFKIKFDDYGTLLDSKFTTLGLTTSVGFMQSLVDLNEVSFGVVSGLTAYNNNINDNSYVTKKWVDDNFATLDNDYYSENGITLTGNTFSLGGTIDTNNVVFTSTTYSFIYDVNAIGMIINDYALQTSSENIISFTNSLLIGDNNYNYDVDINGDNISLKSNDHGLFVNSTTVSNSDIYLSDDVISMYLNNNLKLKLSAGDNEISTYNNSFDYNGSSLNKSNSNVPGSSGFRISEFATTQQTSTSIFNEISYTSTSGQMIVNSDEFWGIETYIIATDGVISKYWKIDALANGNSELLVSKTITVIGFESGTENWDVDVTLEGSSPSRLAIKVNSDGDTVDWNVSGRINIIGGDNI